jgi:cyclic pyranopterin phosphate synthase
MSEDMTFLPKKDVLTLEELERLCNVFVKLGVKKLRLTGGEPLVRKNIMSLIRNLGHHLDTGDLEELTLTTNGSQLHRYAAELFDCGVRRVNVSIDTLDSEKFNEITRWGKLENVLRGIEAAANAGLKIKLNTVALRGTNEDELPNMVKWAGERGFDITIIEVMPMGDIGAENRVSQYLPLSMVRSNLSEHFTLTDIDYKTGGPAR